MAGPASASGDLDGLTRLLTEEATLWVDGGGRVRGAATRPVIGREAVAVFYMGASRPSFFIEKVTVPILALRPKSEMDDPDSITQFEHFEKLGIRTYISNPGVHASSMLVEERAGGDVSATWEVVWDYL